MRRNNESSVLIALGFTLHFAAPMICPLLYGVNSLRFGILLEISPKGHCGLAIMLNCLRRQDLKRVAFLREWRKFITGCTVSELTRGVEAV